MSSLKERFDAVDAQGSLVRPPGGEPIFLLSAGWRSGSTLLQRLVCSSGKAFIWGEPHGQAGVIPLMTRSACVLREDWPSEESIAPRGPMGDVSERWIANLCPETQDLYNGYRAFFDSWLAYPAASRGAARFGLKEVRLDAENARFLEWVYPDARFVFLVRNPYDTWASAKGMGWEYLWPNRILSTVEEFVSHWRRLAEGFAAWQGDNALLVRYEDVVSNPRAIDDLIEHVGLADWDPKVLENRVRGWKAPPTPLTAVELVQIRELAGPIAQKLGYQGPEWDAANRGLVLKQAN